MRHKNNAGYSLVEVVVAMAILALIIVPVSTGMVTAFKMNAKAEQLMQAELAVSRAVEALMARGIDGTEISEDTYPGLNLDAVNVDLTDKGAYYKATVTSRNVNGVRVETYIRAVEESTEPTAAGEG